MLSKPKLKLGRLTLIVALNFFLAAPALANIRAPVTNHLPSGALSGAAAGLVVQRADLRMICDKDCAVRVRYQIEAQKPGIFKLEFILPDSVSVKSKVNQQVQTIQASPYKLASFPSRISQPRIEETKPLHAASFPASLRKGSNLIEISYQQPFGLDERKFEGYFSGWNSAREVRYEMWPLREWKLSPQFKFKFTISFTPQTLEEMGALLRCYENPDSPPKTIAAAPVERGQAKISFSLEWGASFPARLECLLGSQEVMDSYQPGALPSF